MSVDILQNFALLSVFFKRHRGSEEVKHEELARCVVDRQTVHEWGVYLIQLCKEF